MAWTTPRTWTADVVTVPQMNEQIRDNMTLLKTAIDANGLPTVANGIRGISGSDYTVTYTDQMVIVFTNNTITFPAASSPVSITVKSIGVIVPIVTAAGGYFDYLAGPTAGITLYPYDSLTFTGDGGSVWWIS